MTGSPLRAWLPDLIFADGVFESGLALVADSGGTILRLSEEAEDLAIAERLPGRAMLPGLVNVHSHAFQRVIRGRTEHRTSADRDTFWTWREAMYHAANAMTPENLYHAARMAFLEMMLSGITAVGEFHYVHQDLNVLRATLRAASEVGLRVRLLRTAYMRAGWKKEPNPGQARFLTADMARFFSDTDTLIAEGARVGVAPHSIRAVPIAAVREIAEYAEARDLPLHMHVSEQPAEVEACLAEYGRRPVQLLHDHGILKEGFTAIHAIHISEEEAAMLGGSTVCACPTSERNLGDGAVPADRLLAAGARICLGSDSNTQIDLLEDARELEYHLRMTKLERAVIETPRLFQAATESGAKSLMLPCGALEPGRAADFFTVDLNDLSIAGASRESLPAHIVFSLEKTALRDVCVAGNLVVRGGKHPLQEKIVAEFDELQSELWG
ncbi:MAG TPA: formimidoylglutamate deiminase [Bryobacteraceae bacterium]|nr:formimidoylglutamate deiminase [Bryobacteraceae bacterium]